MSVLPDMVGMTARDLQATLDFYRQLGLPLPKDAHLSAEGEPEQHVELTVAGYRLAWTPFGVSATPPSRILTGAGWTCFARCKARQKILKRSR